MEARFQLKWWRMIGVCPLGAQVRLVTGSSETPLSSQNTMAALRRRAFLADPWPVGGDPAGDRPLVAFHRAAGGALQPVAHAVAQQLPDVAGVVGDPSCLLDHARHSGKGPVVAVEAMGAGALAQRVVDRLQLGVGQAGCRPGGAAACQRLGPARLPPGVPAADVLAGHAQLAGDLGLGAAGGKQRAGLHPDVFERLAVTQTAGVASVGGWSHLAMLPECRRNARGSLMGWVGQERPQAALVGSSRPSLIAVAESNGPSGIRDTCSMVGRAGGGGSGASALQCDGCAGTCPSWPRAIRRSDAWRSPHSHVPCGYPPERQEHAADRSMGWGTAAMTPVPPTPPPRLALPGPQPRTRADTPLERSRQVRFKSAELRRQPRASSSTPRHRASRTWLGTY